VRINKYIAACSPLSRRAADIAIAEGRVLMNGQSVSSGYDVQPSDTIMFDGQLLTLNTEIVTIMMNKPAGYVVSRNGQGSATIFELLPDEFKTLQPVGRLDKDSSGLLLLTNDGQLANQLTHPKYAKQKIYEIAIDKPLQPLHQQVINDRGIQLEDGLSKLQLEKLSDNAIRWRITMREGRNRQIRRTFTALGYKVEKLHRTNFGEYTLKNLHSSLLFKKI
jgi:23S rRNA pseudouridine2605 synthase